MADQSKSQQVYEWITSRIRTWAYEPGDRLVLSTIANELGISVVPVREAIRQLEAEGLVTFERNVGAKVTTFNREAYFETMEIIATLESAATALAGPYLTPEDLAKAREINRRMADIDVLRNPEDFTRLNKEFHSVLFAPCPNQRLVALVVEQWEKLEYHRVSTFRAVPERSAESVCEHERLVGLIEVGADPDYVAREVRVHRLRTSQAYRQQVENHPSPVVESHVVESQQAGQAVQNRQAI